MATVDGRKITQGEWDQAPKNKPIACASNRPTWTLLPDSPRAKYQALEGLVGERVLEAAAAAQHFTPSEQRITEIFWRDPQFEFLRNPDGTVNQTVLAAQGMSPGMLKQRLAKQLALQQVTQGWRRLRSVVPQRQRSRLTPLLQQREIQVQRFDPQEFAAKLSPTDAELEAFYKDTANAAQFQLPEQAQIQYVVLDLEALKKDVSFTEDNLRSYYAENANRYGVPEERRASHILIKAERNDPGMCGTRPRPRPPSCWRRFARRQAASQKWPSRTRRMKVPPSPVGPRLLLARRHGQGVRRCRLRDEAGRDF